MSAYQTTTSPPNDSSNNTGGGGGGSSGMSLHSPTQGSQPSYQSSSESHHHMKGNLSKNELSTFDLLSDQPPPDDLGSLLRDESLFGFGLSGGGGGGVTSNNIGGGGGIGSTSHDLINSSSHPNNLSSLLTDTSVDSNNQQQQQQLISPSQITSNNLAAMQQQQQQQKPLSFDYLYEFSETRKVLEEFFTCQTSNDKILEKLSDFNESDVGGSYDNIDQDELNHHHLNNSNNCYNTENNTLVGSSGIGVGSGGGSGNNGSGNVSYIGQRLAKFPVNDEYQTTNSHSTPSQRPTGNGGSGGLLYHNQDQQHQSQLQQQQTRHQSHNMRHDDIYDHQDIELFLDSGSRSSGELGDTEVEHNVDGHTRNFTLSPETTDYDSNCGDLDSELSLRYTGLGGEFGEL